MSGKATLREAVVARSHKMNTATLARDLATPAETLYQFSIGKIILPPATLQALTTYLFGGHVVYDPSIDRLRSANTAEPRSQGSGPPPITQMMTLPKHSGGPPPPQPGYGGPPKPKPKAKRAGWVE